MNVPPTVEQQIDLAWLIISADPKHNLPPRVRRDIYDRFGLQSDPLRHKARGWLAVIAAQHVLPLFQQHFPDDDAPQQLIDTAINVLENRIDDATAKKVQHWGDAKTQNLWGYPASRIPLKIEIVGECAFHALCEARGFDPLQSTSNVPEPASEEVARTLSSLRGGNFVDFIEKNRKTDADVWQYRAMDTAGLSAVAYACRLKRAICDPTKLLQFWEWWLIEAIPQAWAMI